MPQQDLSISQRTAAALAQLQPVAKEVSDAAEHLAKPIGQVDAALKRMNIAFEAWVTYKSGAYEDDYWKWDIGYSRIAERWGIGLRTISGDERFPERVSVEKWHFNESPLYLRHRAVEKLPELLEALAKTGTNVAKKLTGAVANAIAIAETVAPPAKAKK